MKTENVEKVLVLIQFVRGGGANEGFGRKGWGRQHGLDSGRFEVQKVICSIKNALWLYSELCFLCTRGAHFQKVHEKMLPESEKWSQNYVRYIKIPPKWDRIHEDGVKIMSDILVKSPKEATCSNNTHKCNF